MRAEMPSAFRFKLVEIPDVEQPELPKGFPYDGRRIKWPAQTVEWWAHWNGSPLARGFTQHDWDYLLDTAVLHAQFWLGLGGPRVLGEIRQRLAKFGVTPADRARLRIMFVTADEAEDAKRRTDAVNGRVGVSGNVRRLTSLSLDTNRADPGTTDDDEDSAGT